MLANDNLGRLRVILNAYTAFLDYFDKLLQTEQRKSDFQWPILPKIEVVASLFQLELLTWAIVLRIGPFQLHTYVLQVEVVT